MAAHRHPLIVIVGPTASGKSAVALKIAKEFGGEIISADSRTIYKGANIGTAKPTAGDQSAVRHWGLDLVEPGERFTVSDFKNYAEAAIKDIRQRGKLPVIGGGTGLYVEALLFDYELRPAYDPALRAKLAGKTTEGLQKIIQDKGYKLPENSSNKRHLIRIIETKGQEPIKKPLRTDAAVFGIMPSREELRGRITARVEAMFTGGLLDEVRGLKARYGSAKVERSGIGYGPVLRFLENGLTLEQAKKEFVRGDWQYARRQITWWKRHQFVQWWSDQSNCYEAIKGYLDRP